MPDTSPLVRKLQTNIAATAAASDLTQSVGEAPFDGTLTSVSYTPKADITGANTDSRTLTLVNKGSDGNGTTVAATLALTSGVNASDYDEKAFTLSAVAGATTVAAGDILAVVSTHVGSTGLADPGGLVQVEITRS
jgi:hypothetical protein